MMVLFQNLLYSSMYLHDHVIMTVTLHFNPNLKSKINKNKNKNEKENKPSLLLL